MNKLQVARAPVDTAVRTRYLLLLTVMAGFSVTQGWVGIDLGGDRSTTVLQSGKQRLASLSAESATFSAMVKTIKIPVVLLDTQEMRLSLSTTRAVHEYLDLSTAVEET